MDLLRVSFLVSCQREAAIVHAACNYYQCSHIFSLLFLFFFCATTSPFSENVPVIRVDNFSGLAGIAEISYPLFS